MEEEEEEEEDEGGSSRYPSRSKTLFFRGFFAGGLTPPLGRPRLAGAGGGVEWVGERRAEWSSKEDSDDSTPVEETGIDEEELEEGCEGREDDDAIRGGEGANRTDLLFVARGRWAESIVGELAARGGS